VRWIPILWILAVPIWAQLSYAECSIHPTGNVFSHGVRFELKRPETQLHYLFQKAGCCDAGVHLEIARRLRKSSVPPTRFENSFLEMVMTRLSNISTMARIEQRTNPEGKPYDVPLPIIQLAKSLKRLEGFFTPLVLERLTHEVAKYSAYRTNILFLMLLEEAGLDNLKVKYFENLRRELPRGSLNLVRIMEFFSEFIEVGGKKNFRKFLREMTQDVILEGDYEMTFRYFNFLHSINLLHTLDLDSDPTHPAFQKVIDDIDYAPHDQLTVAPLILLTLLVYGDPSPYVHRFQSYKEIEAMLESFEPLGWGEPMDKAHTRALVILHSEDDLLEE
jgi:hypothetical protein